MIDLQHLEELVAFAEYGTLSKAAEALLISQPALTRSMQHLEDDLGVNLFKRQKNRIRLTETGEYTVDQAKQLLAASDKFLENVQHFNLSQSVIFIGISAPAIEWEINQRFKENQFICEVKYNFDSDETLINQLLKEDITVAVTSYEPEDEAILSKVFFKEQLQLAVPPAHPLALKDEIELADLEDLTMLLRTDIGVWSFIKDLLPETKFIEQSDDIAFEELIKASALPHFSTNMSELYGNANDARVHIPIVDPEATLTFYVSVLKKNKSLLDQFK